MPKIIGMPPVHFNLDDWDAKGPTYIILFFHHRPKGQRLKYYIGKKIDPKQWDRERQRAKGNKRFFDESFELNDYLARLERAVQEIYREHGGTLENNEFKKEIKVRMGEATPEHHPQLPATFLEFVDVYIAEQEQKPGARESTLKTIRKYRNHLRNYARERGKKLSFPEINGLFFKDFRNWLHAPPRQQSSNTVSRTFRYIKTFAREAETRGLPIDKSYQGFKVSQTPVSRIALTFAELDQLEALDLSQNVYLEIARDLFIIGAYTGLRYSDFIRIEPHHIQEHDGLKIIEMVAQKTSQELCVPLHHKAERVLEKYGFSAPKMDNQVINRKLKELGQLAGFFQPIVVIDDAGGSRKERTVAKWEMLSTHVARRTFATAHLESHPQMIESIRGITGHTTEKEFRKYTILNRREHALRLAKIFNDSKTE